MKIYLAICVVVGIGSCFRDRPKNPVTPPIPRF
jgi:hypothetical protein